VHVLGAGGGAITLASTQPERLTVSTSNGTLSESLEDAQFLADAVGAALLDETATTGAVPFAAWSDRARVHQATGMVVAQLALPAEDALALLRAHAFAESATLDQIAVAVVERELQLSSTDQGVSHDAADPEDRPGRGRR
jgi:hypothetical protein